MAGVGLKFPAAALGVAPGVTERLQVDPADKVLPQVEVMTVPCGKEELDTVTFVAADVPVLAMVIARACPDAVDPKVSPVTLSAKSETEAVKVVFRFAVFAVTAEEVTDPNTAVIFAEPTAMPLARPLNGDALLIVMTDILSDAQFTWLVMS